MDYFTQKRKKKCCHVSHCIFHPEYYLEFRVFHLVVYKYDTRIPMSKHVEHLAKQLIEMNENCYGYFFPPPRELLHIHTSYCPEETFVGQCNYCRLRKGLNQLF